jgi:hypothetical protein
MNVKRAIGLFGVSLGAALSFAGSADAHQSLDAAWNQQLSGSELTSQYNLTDPQTGNVISTVDNDYYFCSDGTFVHKRRIIAGGEPPFASLLTGGPSLDPQGRWKVIVVDGGFGTAQAQLVLSSANGAIRQYSLGYSNGKILIEGVSFARDAGSTGACGGQGDAFGPESPLR